MTVALGKHVRRGLGIGKEPAKENSAFLTEGTTAISAGSHFRSDPDSFRCNFNADCCSRRRLCKCKTPSLLFHDTDGTYEDYARFPVNSVKAPMEQVDHMAEFLQIPG